MNASQFSSLLRNVRWPIVLGLALLAPSAPARTQDPADQRRAERQIPEPTQNVRQQIERGRYLVHDVAMCVECHTPRTAAGELQVPKLLQGAPMPVASPFPAQQWAFRAPALAGLPGGWSKEELLHFLQTGEPANRGPIRPPMPPFRMTEEDATAVAEYLESL